MNDFDLDVLEKKRIARSAFLKPRHSGCTLPSDTMTRREIAAMHGEVKTYNVTRPMKWSEYKRLPDDLKREYWRNMQSCGGAATWLKDHMGVSNDTILNAAKAVGCPFKRGAHEWELWQAAKYRWAIQDGAEITQKRTEDAVECSNTPPEEKPVEPLKTPVALAHARLVLAGDREGILQHLALLMPDGGEIVVEW